MKKSCFLSVRTIVGLLFAMIPICLFAQEITPVPVAELMEGAIPEGAIKLEKKDGYTRLKAIDPDQAFTEDEIVGEFYAKDNIIFVFTAGKAKTPLKDTELEDTRAMLMEMDGRDTSYRYFGEEDPNTIKNINNYKVLITKRKTIPVYFYYLIGSDKISCLNFSITAKPEDIEKAKALGDSMLNSMKFK